MTIDLHVLVEAIATVVVALLAWSLRGNWANIRETQQDIRLDVQSIRQDHRTLYERITEHGQSIAVIEARIEGIKNRSP